MAYVVLHIWDPSQLQPYLWALLQILYYLYSSCHMLFHTYIPVMLSQQSQIWRWYNSNGRKWRGTEESTDEGEKGEKKAGIKLNIKKN